MKAYTMSKDFAAATGTSATGLWFLRGSPHKRAPTAPEEWLIPSRSVAGNTEDKPEQLVQEERKMSRWTGLCRCLRHQGQSSTGQDGTMWTWIRGGEGEGGLFKSKTQRSPREATVASVPPASYTGVWGRGRKNEAFYSAFPVWTVFLDNPNALGDEKFALLKDFS